MPAQPWSTGAIHLFVQLPSSAGPTQPQYLGTPETFPKDERKPEYEMLMNDVSGRKKPLDLSFQGIDATISLVLTRWDAVVMNALERTPGTLGGAGGSYSFNDVGALMGFEGFATTLWLVRTFGSVLANKAAYASDIAGRRYLQCVVWAPLTEEDGAQGEKKHVLFYSWPRPDFNARKFVLWDTDMTGINASMIT